MLQYTTMSEQHSDAQQPQPQQVPASRDVADSSQGKEVVKNDLEAVIETPHFQDSVSGRLFGQIPQGLPTLVKDAEKAYGVQIDCAGERLVPYLPFEVKGDPENVSKFCCSYQRVPDDEKNKLKDDVSETQTKVSLEHVLDRVYKAFGKRYPKSREDLEYCPMQLRLLLDESWENYSYADLVCGGKKRYQDFGSYRVDIDLHLYGLEKFKLPTGGDTYTSSRLQKKYSPEAYGTLLSIVEQLPEEIKKKCEGLISPVATVGEKLVIGDKISCDARELLRGWRKTKQGVFRLPSASLVGLEALAEYSLKFLCDSFRDANKDGIRDLAFEIHPKHYMQDVQPRFDGIMTLSTPSEGVECNPYPLWLKLRPVSTFKGDGINEVAQNYWCKEKIKL